MQHPDTDRADLDVSITQYGFPATPRTLPVATALHFSSTAITDSDSAIADMHTQEASGIHDTETKRYLCCNTH
jgi:hypothetical protein